MSNGAPADSDRNSLSLSPNGPLLLHDVHLVDTLAHFNRENVPERRPHAKGSGAFGEFRVTDDVSRYTEAAVFQPGVTSRMLTRFSTVAGELGSPDTWRDVRGFSLRFYPPGHLPDGRPWAAPHLAEHERLRLAHLHVDQRGRGALVGEVPLPHQPGHRAHHR